MTLNVNVILGILLTFVCGLLGMAAYATTLGGVAIKVPFADAGRR